MNPAEQSQLRQALHGRCDVIADGWYTAIAGTGFAPRNAVKVRQRLAELTEQVIALLLTEPFDHGRAQAIGASLAGLHDYIQPEALGKTQEALGRWLVKDLLADQVVALQPRLGALLGGLAVGFFQQARQRILAEQEQIRKALINEGKRAEEALQKAHNELERRVEERTAELAKTNKELQTEITERKQAEEERERLIVGLQEALAKIKTLRGLIPICAHCKKIRDDQGYWNHLEAYIQKHSEAEFSHGICDECAHKLYPELFRGDEIGLTRE